MIIFVIFFTLVFCFGFVLLLGAPYLPTQTKQSGIAIKLLGLKSGQKFYELGCGDGKVLILAAKAGLVCVGYELNPLLFLVAKIRCLKYQNVSVKFGNFWKSDLSSADGVYVFLLDKYMSILDKKLQKEFKKGARLASYTFKIQGKKPLVKERGIFVYQY